MIRKILRLLIMNAENSSDQRSEAAPAVDASRSKVQAKIARSNSDVRVFPKHSESLEVSVPRKAYYAIDELSVDSAGKPTHSVYWFHTGEFVVVNDLVLRKYLGSYRPDERMPSEILERARHIVMNAEPNSIWVLVYPNGELHTIPPDGRYLQRILSREGAP